MQTDWMDVLPEYDATYACHRTVGGLDVVGQALTRQKPPKRRRLKARKRQEMRLSRAYWRY